MGFIKTHEDFRDESQFGEKDLTRRLMDMKTFDEVLKELRSPGPEEVIVSGDTFKRDELLKAFESYRQYVQDNWKRKQTDDPDLFLDFFDSPFPSAEILGKNQTLKQEALIYAEHEEPDQKE